MHDGAAYQANYQAGLRVLGVDRIAEGALDGLGFFDTIPGRDSSDFEGAWTAYPFFPSGTIAIGGTNGLFLVRFDDPRAQDAPSSQPQSAQRRW